MLAAPSFSPLSSLPQLRCISTWWHAVCVHVQQSYSELRSLHRLRYTNTRTNTHTGLAWGSGRSFGVHCRFVAHIREDEERRNTLAWALPSLGKAVEGTRITGDDTSAVHSTPRELFGSIPQFERSAKNVAITCPAASHISSCASLLSRGRRSTGGTAQARKANPSLTAGGAGKSRHCTTDVVCLTSLACLRHCFVAVI